MVYLQPDVTTMTAAAYKAAIDVATAALAQAMFSSKPIVGLTYGNNVTDIVNDIDVFAGGASDTTFVDWMALASTMTKRLDANWVVGTNQGGLDTGAIANAHYYIWLIKRSDTGVVDVLFSLSSTSPTMPASYNRKRLIGWFIRVSATIVLFNTYEIEGGGVHLLWNAPTTDISLAATLSSTKRSDSIKVPQDFSVLATMNANALDAGSSGSILITCPDETGAVISFGAGAGAHVMLTVTAGALVGAQVEVRTSSIGKIQSVSTITTVDNYYVSTLGFKWARRN